MNIRADATTQEKPPFRAEHIGSLLRPSSLLQKRERFAHREISQADLTAAEDAAISGAVALQEQVGLRLATDGEFRRRSYHSFFYQQLGDISIDTVAGVDAKAGGNAAGRGQQPIALIKSRVNWTHPINVADFNCLRSKTKLLPKITIPGPCALHYRGGDTAVLAYAYRDTGQFWDDIVKAFEKELTALAEAGCRYIQIDETAFAKFGDPDVRTALAARGDDWDSLIDGYIAITNRVLHAAPKSLHIGMHLCRGNRAGYWHAEGSYENVAERLFNALDIQFFFLEYDTPRAGTFTPLRFVPKHKSIVLGLVSSKTPILEDKSVLLRRIEEASRHVAIDRLAVSPQCGFASVDTGNPVTPEIQKAKLRLVVELANDLWGET